MGVRRSVKTKSQVEFRVTIDYQHLTEVAGEKVSKEQVQRMARRYVWAASYCRGLDVLEMACGTGQGLGYLSTKARSVVGGDISRDLLVIARRHYGAQISLQQCDALHPPFRDATFDCVILMEALYYLSDLPRFFQECRRLLKPRGRLLIATANKDLFDFTPSAHSYRYLGVIELEKELSAHGFDVACFGDTPIGDLSIRQRVLRPLKALVSRSGLMPETMAGKKLFKRLVFGELVAMPPEIDDSMTAQASPKRLPNGQADRKHKVILCEATLRETA